jgi:hypothetical protein
VLLAFLAELVYRPRNRGLARKVHSQWKTHFLGSSWPCCDYLWGWLSRIRHLRSIPRSGSRIVVFIRKECLKSAWHCESKSKRWDKHVKTRQNRHGDATNSGRMCKERHRKGEHAIVYCLRRASFIVKRWIWEACSMVPEEERRKQREEQVQAGAYMRQLSRWIKLTNHKI